jgi:hypothetical protein
LFTYVAVLSLLLPWGLQAEEARGGRSTRERAAPRSVRCFLGGVPLFWGAYSLQKRNGVQEVYIFEQTNTFIMNENVGRAFQSK